MRGKASAAAWIIDDAGITPAHAGKSKYELRAERATEDHPRPCGEKKVSGQTLGDLPGSPPPMRGKEAKNLKPVKKPGITPAHAGKSELVSLDA